MHSIVICISLRGAVYLKMLLDLEITVDIKDLARLYWKTPTQPSPHLYKTVVIFDVEYRTLNCILYFKL